MQVSIWVGHNQGSKTQLVSNNSNLKTVLVEYSFYDQFQF